ncbi:MAG: UDP-N-acetylmuramate dehydrogenase [Pseudanabaenaceae cyanobacterium bins.68]|nr:UDP-N-acetylmuramate dehydrogenase [Pseudanabaenaceae cyanobacterium bins.68]
MVTLPQLIRPRQFLAAYTSLKVGGAADFFAAPRSLAELDQVLEWQQGEDLPITCIGAGSNLLISDRGLRGLVISTKYLRGLRLDQGQVFALAGESAVSLARQVGAKGWAGLEWAIGIPGSIGGLAVMNAGAQGGCMADCLIEIEVLDLTRRQRQCLKVQELAYRYRSSWLQTQPHLLVLTATLQLQPDQNPELVIHRTNSYLKQRQASQPYHLPSCGSVFRNPPGTTAGRLIEAAGLKGHEIGKAQVAHLHSNFILNLGGATATDIYQLIGHIQTVVADQTGIWLEPEVKMLGEFS